MARRPACPGNRHARGHGRPRSFATAHNLDEALEILRQAKVFVSTLWLVGSRADGKFIVVEKTPRVTASARTGGRLDCLRQSFPNCRPATTATQHELRLRGHVGLARSANGRTAPASARDAATRPRAAQILRDRNLPGGAFAGNGHRATFNAFIATHATVMDLTDGIFWAASPPNQLGKFVAFDVQDFDHELPERTILNPTQFWLRANMKKRGRPSTILSKDGGY